MQPRLPESKSPEQKQPERGNLRNLRLPDLGDLQQVRLSRQPALPYNPAGNPFVTVKTPFLWNHEPAVQEEKRQKAIQAERDRYEYKHPDNEEPTLRSKRF